MADSTQVDSTLAKILGRWEQEEGGKGEQKEESLAKEPVMDITEQMQKITQEKLANFSLKKVEQTEEQLAMKAAILQGYSEVADGDSDCESDSGDTGGALAANTNAESVAKEAAEARERQQQAAKDKKDKDKADRANQKAAQEERKKKAQEKAAKGG